MGPPSTTGSSNNNNINDDSSYSATPWPATISTSPATSITTTLPKDQEARHHHLRCRGSAPITHRCASSSSARQSPSSTSHQPCATSKPAAGIRKLARVTATPVPATGQRQRPQDTRESRSQDEESCVCLLAPRAGVGNELDADRIARSYSSRSRVREANQHLILERSRLARDILDQPELLMMMAQKEEDVRLSYINCRVSVTWNQESAVRGSRPPVPDRHIINLSFRFRAYQRHASATCASCVACQKRRTRR